MMANCVKFSLLICFVSANRFCCEKTEKNSETLDLLNAGHRLQPRDLLTQ
jgi:hypothetical protein